MKQTNLRNDAIKWWGEQDHPIRFELGQKYFKRDLLHKGIGEDEIEQIYLKETSISNDSLEFELRYSQRGKYYFIDKREAGEGYTIAQLKDENINDIEQLMFQANNYNALKQANKELIEALENLIKVAARETKDLIAWDGVISLDASIDRAKEKIQKAKQL